MKSNAASGVIGLLTFLAVLSLNQPAVSDSLAPNTIPVIAMKTGQGDASLDLTMQAILRLLWHDFDGVWLEGWVRLTEQESGMKALLLVLLIVPLWYYEGWESVHFRDNERKR